MHFTEQAKKRTGIAILFLILAATAILWKYAGAPLVQAVSDPAAFRDWVNSHGAYSRLAFVGMVIFQILIAVIPGEPFEIAAGYAFGAWEGTALCMFAATLGSLATFWLVRRFGIKLVRLFFSEEQLSSVRFLKSTQKRDFIFLIVYMLPGTPKDLLGFFAGLTDIRLGVWLMICSLGRFPSIVTSTVGGNALGTENYTMAVLVFAATLAVSALGLLIYNEIRRRHKGGNSEP